MKKIILASLVLGSTLTFAQSPNNTSKRPEKKDLKVTVGALAGYSSKLYKTDNGNGVFAPILKVEYKGLYFKGTEIGYTFPIDDNLQMTTFVEGFGGLTLIGNTRSFNGKALEGSDMKSGYKEIEDRKTQVEGGVKLKYETGIERIQLTGELRGGARGGTLSVGLMQPYMFGPKLYVFPNVNLSVINSNMTDYYFGVDQKEVNKASNDKLDKVYNPYKLGLATSVGVTTTYILTSNWSLFGTAQVQHLNDAISGSPLVKNKVNFFTGVGINYSF